MSSAVTKQNSGAKYLGVSHDSLLCLNENFVKTFDNTQINL